MMKTIEGEYGRVRDDFRKAMDILAEINKWASETAEREVDAGTERGATDAVLAYGDAAARATSYVGRTQQSLAERNQLRSAWYYIVFADTWGVGQCLK
jgi:hypothetical protein